MYPHFLTAWILMHPPYHIPDYHLKPTTIDLPAGPAFATSAFWKEQKVLKTEKPRLTIKPTKWTMRDTTVSNCLISLSLEPPTLEGGRPKCPSHNHPSFKTQNNPQLLSLIQHPHPFLK